MKKRWGKPITQVQRFVPQEYIAQCTYTLMGVGGSVSTGVEWNDIRIDWYYPTGTYSSREKTVFKNTNTTVLEKDKDKIIDVSTIYDIYQYVSGTENSTSKYNNTTEAQYKPYLGSTIYMYSTTKMAYKGMKSEGAS